MMSLLALRAKIMMIGRVIKIMVVRNCKLDEQLKRNVCNRFDHHQSKAPEFQKPEFANFTKDFSCIS